MMVGLWYKQLMQKIPLVIVSAMSRKRRAIGNKNQLLWHLPSDLKHFKELTLGHPIIMGRNTYESIIQILGKPLPGRINIVLARSSEAVSPGAKVAHSLEAGIELAEAENPTEIHIGGGAMLYHEALPLVDRLHLTLVDDEPEADTFFPDFTNDFEITKESEPMTENGITFQWIDYKRK
jgi:dihydrofolate reductase